MAILTRTEPGPADAAPPGGRTGRPSGARRVERARSLPGGRAVVGGLLVGVAAVGTFAVWQSGEGGPDERYVVLAADVAPGERLTSEHLRLEPAELPAATAAQAFAEDDASLAVGQLVVAPLAEGDLLLRSAAVVPDDAEPDRQVSFPVEASRALAGTLQRGELVDVIVTGSAGSRLAAEGARIAQVLVDDIGGDVVVLASVPVDVDIVEVAELLQTGEVTLVRSTGAPPIDADAIPSAGLDDETADETDDETADDDTGAEG